MMFLRAKRIDAFRELNSQQLTEVNGGKQVMLDGALIEMSDFALSALINSGAVRSVTIRGVALHNSEL